MFLVTGCTGFVGRHLMRPDCVGMDSTWEFPKKGDFTHVIHAATTRSRLDIELTDDVLDFAYRTKAKVVYISSGAAKDCLDEYGRVKRACESLVTAYGHSVLRLYSFIGPGLPIHLAPATMLHDLKAKRPISVMGTGAVVRSYMDADQMAGEIWKRIDDDGIAEIGSTLPVTMLELATVFASYGDGQVVLRGGEDGLRPYYVPEEGQEPELTLDEMVELYIGGSDDDFRRLVRAGDGEQSLGEPR